ncbi:MAG: radical SAM protein [Anaerovibrio sp.]|uniref:radical SAM protein n=1 Tax=Anaerovibrio sp. TaxID=1872532 RepID=UPI0025CEAE1D|nr:radical SAM protein [Anaerovibrio sp.]MCR5177042.1 radical SAM protein [Anaerovibrio sp.]
MKKPDIIALYADENGEIFDAPGILAMGREGKDTRLLTPDDLIPLPESADLIFLPDRQALGMTPDGEVLPLTGNAVSAILPAGYTRTMLPAFSMDEGVSRLPLYGYTAVCVYKDQLYAAAVYTDENHKWDPEHYNTKNLKQLIKRVKKDLPDNPLIAHLANCSLEWHCCTAENLFYRRWECGIPTSPVCNANCFGCISLQPAECCPSPQSRIKFRPTPEQIAEVGIYHLDNAPEGIISFGQGCEGEPSLAADNIAAGIRLIREKTTKGQININTNAGYTEGIRRIVDAGLDTMRVSIISAIPESYDAYYRSNYRLEDVKASIDYALKKGIYVSLNMLYFPGFNDRHDELDAWKDFFKELPVQMIQVRNLNIDPDAFLAVMPEAQTGYVGTRRFLRELKKEFPQMEIGSFSHYIE